MDRKGAQFCDEMKVLRMKMARWDQRNRAEMSIALLKGPQDGSQVVDYTYDVRDCVNFAM